MIELLNRRIRKMLDVAREESDDESEDELSPLGLAKAEAFHLLEIRNILNGEKTCGVYDDYGDPPTVHGPLFTEAGQPNA
jgi:hypothetical protein